MAEFPRRGALTQDETKSPPVIGEGGAHTPGPWNGPTKPYDSVPWLHVYGSDGRHIMHETRSQEEKLANARLCVAAPDMADELALLRTQNEKLVEALKGVNLFFKQPEEDSTEAFERVALIFRQETGYLRPGKDCATHDYSVRQKAWDEWVAQKLDAARAALRLASGGR